MYKKHCIIEHDSYCGVSVMVWTSVSLHHNTNIVFINGNLTAARCKHFVLDTEVIPLLRNHRGMQLLHDGAPAHRARTTTTYLNANNVNVADFPPKSPDLNIIENIWDELKRRVRRTGAISTTLNELRAEWNNLPQNYVQWYVTSKRHRCVAVVNSADGHTHYKVYMGMNAAAGFDIRK